MEQDLAPLTSNSAAPESPIVSQSIAVRLVEVAAIVLLFWIYVGPNTPEVNEPHYLAKARHYWNPSWCPSDHFLNSSDAHYVFYWAFGWVTQLTSFPVAVWIGRFVCWLAIACSWQRLIWLLFQRNWLSIPIVVTGTMAILHGHMAGEWLIGGVEAKCIAYGFAVWAIGDAVQNRWNRAWILLGIASAFHVLVGGWMVVCLLGAWSLTSSEKPTIVAMLPGLVTGGMLAMIGVYPLLILNLGSDPDVNLQASYVYVFERLSHHLVVHRFAGMLKLRFLAIAIAWAVTAFALRKERSVSLLNLVAASSLGLVFAGVLIDQIFAYWLLDFGTAAKFLRLYWFRIADVVVPLMLSMNLWYLWFRYRKDYPKVASGAIAVLLCVVFVGLGFRAYERWSTSVSPADRSSYVSDPGSWIATCHWIDRNLEPGAIFLTPRLQSTFKWYAQRAEVVTTKDVPQDNQNLLEWRQRRVDVYLKFREPAGALTLAKLDQDEVLQLAEKYQFRYLVLDRHLADREGVVPTWEFKRIFPEKESDSASYEVYEISP